MNLLEEIQTKVSADVIASKDYNTIASIVNVDRTKLTNKEIGIGVILDTIGIVEGNALLDFVYSQSDFRYVKLLVEQGKLNISLPIVVATINSLVGVILTQENADKLIRLGIEADPIQPYQVLATLTGSM